MPAICVTVPIEIKSDIVCSLVVSSFEGGSNYWLHEANLADSGGYNTESENVIFWGQDGLYEHDFKMELRFDDPKKPEGNGKGVKVIGKGDIERGFRVMAEKYPHHLADVLSENMDAITGDVLVQCAIFGEIVYG